jgi:hypothetical protein
MKIYFDLFVIYNTTFSLYEFESTYPVFPCLGKPSFEDRTRQTKQTIPTFSKSQQLKKYKSLNAFFSIVY